MKIDLARKFPKEFFNIIGLVGSLADKERVPVYLVGGPVRDAVLGVPNYDLDFVAEGDALEFSEILNRSLKGSLKKHHAFMTATIGYGNIRIDLAAARKEAYKKPAAYPDVIPGTIKDDLFRRDFTINAMAARLNRENFGGLVDFYNGLKDLKKKVIRVMHERSFIDDPTRIFRAVRFSVRLGFKIDPHAKVLIKKAISAGLLGEVNRGRIKKEIELFLKEKNPKNCMEVFGRLA